MLKVLNIEVEDLPNAGCNNGNYPEFTLIYSDNGHIDSLTGITCGCGCGCSNTCRLPKIGEKFANKAELDDYLNN